MANRIPDWGAVVGLIGTGQEIHDGEESGLQQWVDAVYNTGTQANWDIHAPPGIVEQLNTSEIQVYSEPYLTLNTTIRSHFGEKLHHWVDGVLGHVETPYGDLRDMYESLKETGFKAQLLLQPSQSEDVPLTTGMRNLPKPLWYDLFISRQIYHAAMECERFNGQNRRTMGDGTTNIQQHPESCCALDLPFTEFDTQGLELDFTLVGWGTDFILEDGEWNNDRARNYAHTSDIKDPLYSTKKCLPRVATTRDGMILYLPDTELLGEVRHHLVQCGVEDLSETDALQ